MDRYQFHKFFRDEYDIYRYLAFFVDKDMDISVDNVSSSIKVVFRLKRIENAKVIENGFRNIPPPKKKKKKKKNNNNKYFYEMTA